MIQIYWSLMQLEKLDGSFKSENLKWLAEVD